MTLCPGNRPETGRWLKAGWIFLIFALPFFGILLYIITRPKISYGGMEMAGASPNTPVGAPVRFSAADEIGKAKALLDSGAITADEYAAMKQKAMAWAVPYAQSTAGSERSRRFCFRGCRSGAEEQVQPLLEERRVGG